MTGSVGDLTLDGLQQNTITMAQGNATFGVIQPYSAELRWTAACSRCVCLSVAMRQLLVLETGMACLFPKVKFVPMSSDGMAEKKRSLISRDM
jgi:hypothetical protein